MSLRKLVGLRVRLNHTGNQKCEQVPGPSRRLLLAVYSPSAIANRNSVLTANARNQSSRPRVPVALGLLCQFCRQERCCGR